MTHWLEQHNHQPFTSRQALLHLDSACNCIWVLKLINQQTRVWWGKGQGHQQQGMPTLSHPRANHCFRKPRRSHAGIVDIGEPALTRTDCTQLTGHTHKLSFAPLFLLTTSCPHNVFMYVFFGLCPLQIASAVLALRPWSLAATLIVNLSLHQSNTAMALKTTPGFIIELFPVGSTTTVCVQEKEQ